MATKKAPAPKTAEPAASKAVEAPAKKRAPNAAFMKPLTPSAELAAIVGKKALPRTEITERLHIEVIIAGSSTQQIIHFDPVPTQGLRQRPATTDMTISCSLNPVQ